MPKGVYTRVPKAAESDESIARRFWQNVARSDGCWEWTGLLNTHGYGRFWPGHHMVAHRYSWLLHHGHIPDGRVVMHSCDNRKCVSPYHLSLGTQRDNLLDAKRKGRLPDQRKPYCAKGHRMAGKNVRRRYGKRAGRVCVTCATETRRAWREQRKVNRKNH